ncbi:MAG: hypothetical protein ABI832_17145 [bacterium]
MRTLLLALLLASPATADPLAGKSYIIQMSSSQYASGYGNYLMPPLYKVLAHSGMTSKGGPGADVVVNVETDSDVGRWVGTGAAKVWMYTISATVGISPEAYDIPYEGTPAYGVKAVLQTENPDRQDEMDCLISLAARTALANYRPTGLLQTDGSSCAR